MRLLLPLAAILLAAAPACADPQNAERVARQLLGPGTTSGAFEIRTESGGERVRAPDVVMRIGDERVWFGAVEFLIAPDSRPQRHRFEVTFRDEIVLTDEQGAPKATLRLGENRFSGIWSDERPGVMAPALLWRDMRLDGAAGAWHGAIESLEAVSEGDLDAPSWTGRVALSARGLRFALGHDVTLRAGEAIVEYRGENVPYAAWAALDLGALDRPPSSRKMTAAERERVASLLSALPGFGDRLSGALRLGSFSVSFAGETFGFAGFGFEEGLAREPGDTLEATVGLAVDGLTLPVAFGDLGPDRGGLTLRIGGIPGGRLVHALAESVLDDSVDALGAALDALQNADAATLKLDGAVGGSSYSAVLASAFRIDPNVPGDFLGDAHATIAGLDETLAALSRPPATEDRQRAAAMLALVKAFGAPREDKGATLYDYRFSIDAAGRMLLNGRVLDDPSAPAPSGRP